MSSHPTSDDRVESRRVMDRLDDLVLPEDQNAFSTPYRPSIFLYCILIFWTGACIVLEMVTYLIFIFPITTYCPTIYFAVQAIIRTRRGSHTARQYVEAAAKQSAILACVWTITIVAHIYLWYTDGTSWADLLLLPIFPGTLAILVVFYIAGRQKMHERATRRRSCGRIELPHDEESASVRTNVPTATSESRTEEETPSRREESTSAFETYQPSMFLLAISISLTTFIAVIDGRTLGAKRVYLYIVLIQTHIPTVFSQLYIMTRMIRQMPQTPENLSTIAGFTFEITLNWIWTRVALSKLWPLYDEWALAGVAEIFLMLYLSTRYAFSLSKVATKKYNEIDIQDHTSLNIGGNLPLSPIREEEETADPLETVEAQICVYHPSIGILLAGIILSGLCIYTEILAEYNVGVPMTVLVYAPTIAIYTHLILQSVHNKFFLDNYDKAAELSVQLLVLWTLTQAFYVLVWPIGPYFRLAMNPHIRWPAVTVAVYIAARYRVDRHQRETAGREIALPPDVPDQENSSAPTISSA